MRSESKTSFFVSEIDQTVGSTSSHIQFVSIKSFLLFAINVVSIMFIRWDILSNKSSSVTFIIYHNVLSLNAARLFSSIL